MGEKITVRKLLCYSRQCIQVIFFKLIVNSWKTICAFVWERFGWNKLKQKPIHFSSVRWTFFCCLQPIKNSPCKLILSRHELGYMNGVLIDVVISYFHYWGKRGVRIEFLNKCWGWNIAAWSIWISTKNVLGGLRVFYLKVFCLKLCRHYFKIKQLAKVN